jgi:hypothetical protein
VRWAIEEKGLGVSGQEEAERVAVLEVMGIGRRAAVKPMKRQASISAVWREERRALSWADAHVEGY